MTANLQKLQHFSSFIIHYGEIALKKGNRDTFENLLVQNIRRLVSKDGPCTIRRLQGRIHIQLATPPADTFLPDKLARVFGVANIAAAVRTEASYESILLAVREIVASKSFKSFAVRTRRADKRFPLTSQKVNEEIGADVQKITCARVDLDDPEFQISIEILPHQAFIFSKLVKGPGGLPVGISGKAACLISGGIDSPVAAWRMMKRGCLPLFIHFHSSPFTSSASKEKVKELVTHLMKHQPHTQLIMVPFGEVQQKIVVGVPTAYRVIVYRRFMLRIAQTIARQHGAAVLVTGDALSQVASQTLSNLATIEAASELPVFRPLIGLDKQEIVDEAKQIGTFDIAIQPHDDCCSFLVPRNPVTKTTLEELTKVEQNLDIKSLVQLGLESCEVLEITG